MPAIQAFSDYLFVYGTLRKNIDHPMAVLLSREAHYIGEGYLQAVLYFLGRYPGVVLSRNPQDVVTGDMFALRDAEALFPVLDDYEGYTPEYAQPHEYRREVVTVALEGKRTLPAWTYIYNLPVENLTRIASGDYLRYLSECGEI